MESLELDWASLRKRVQSAKRRVIADHSAHPSVPITVLRTTLVIGGFSSGVTGYRQITAHFLMVNGKSAQLYVGEAKII